MRKTPNLSLYFFGWISPRTSNCAQHPILRYKLLIWFDSQFGSVYSWRLYTGEIIYNGPLNKNSNFLPISCIILTCMNVTPTNISQFYAVWNFQLWLGNSNHMVECCAHTPFKATNPTPPPHNRLLVYNIGLKSCKSGFDELNINYEKKKKKSGLDITSHPIIGRKLDNKHK